MKRQDLTEEYLINGWMQKFTLANSGTKKEVQWIKKQLDKCFQKYELAIMEKHCGVAGEIINKIFNENEAS